jgi:hypothetical protein
MMHGCSAFLGGTFRPALYSADHVLDSRRYVHHALGASFTNSGPSTEVDATLASSSSKPLFLPLHELAILHITSHPGIYNICAQRSSCAGENGPAWRSKTT